MNAVRFRIVSAATVAVLGAGGRASTTDALIRKLGGADDKARSEARQLLPRQSVEAVPRLLPLLASENEAIWRAAFNVLADFANEVSVPGREADRAAVTRHFMTLIAPDQPEAVRLRGLRLLPLVIPAGYDAGPLAALLDEPNLREKARAALEETRTPEAAAALRAYLPRADPEFACAILNSLGRLENAESLDAIRAMTAHADGRVRIAAVRALAWTGDPAHLKTAETVLAAADPSQQSDATDALLRLLHAIEAKGGNWQLVTNTYLKLLKTDNSIVRDAALAGLGRIGDGTCVGPILDVLKTAEPPNSLNAAAAIRAMRGVDVARELVNAYPSLPPKAQLAVVAALGNKKTPLVVSVLKQAAQSHDAGFRLAALRALGETGESDGLDTLIAAADGTSDAERTAARDALALLADALRAQNKAEDAGRAYAAMLATAGDIRHRQRALEGLAACPDANACDAVMAAADDRELAGPAMHALVAVAGALGAAGQKDKAMKAYEKVMSLSPPRSVAETVLKGMHALGAKIDMGTLLGIVTNWWVVGPFDLGEKDEGWNVDYIDEANVNLVGRYMSGKTRVAWVPIVSTDPNGRINLRAAVADRDRCIAYAYTEITLKQDADAVLLIGADDSEKVWVNGRLVYETFVPRALTVDQDRVPVKLKAGVNTILLKIWQNTLGWEFCLRIATPDGKPLPFAQKAQ